MTCPQCGRPHDVGSKFCRGCGARVEPVAEKVADATSVCTACAAPLKPGARFCKQCGAIVASVSAPHVDVEPEPVAANEAPFAPDEPLDTKPVEPPVEPRAAAQEHAVHAEVTPAAATGTSGSMRGIAIAAAVVIAVVAIGGLVTWRFLSKDDAAVTPQTQVVEATPPTPAAQPVTPVDTAPVMPAAATPPAPPAPPPRTEPTVQPVATEPTPVIVDKAAPEPAPPVAAAPRPREKRVAATQPAQTAPMPDVALTLVRKGESAFSRQDYATAIANARAALDVNPGLARARQLLDEAQRAQQQAMNSISIQ